jgi:hypothetical protein
MDSSSTMRRECLEPFYRRHLFRGRKRVDAFGTIINSMNVTSDVEASLRPPVGVGGMVGRPCHNRCTMPQLWVAGSRSGQTPEPASGVRCGQWTSPAGGRGKVGEVCSCSESLSRAQPRIYLPSFHRCERLSFEFRISGFGFGFWGLAGSGKWNTTCNRTLFP